MLTESEPHAMGPIAHQCDKDSNKRMKALSLLRKSQKKSCDEFAVPVNEVGRLREN